MMHKNFLNRSIAVGIIAVACCAAGCAPNVPPPPTTNPVARGDKGDQYLSGAEKTISGFGTRISDGFASVGKKIHQIIASISGDTPAKYAQMMQSPSPDARWEGIANIVDNDFAKRPPSTTRYMQISQSDPDWLVRGVAIRALNRSRDRSATWVYVKGLSDPNADVRLESAKALVHMKDPDAVQPLLKLLNKPDEDKDVRIAAADALRHYKTLEVARALVAALSDRDFGIAYQSRRSLKALTGRDLRYDDAAWLQYITGPEKPFG